MRLPHFHLNESIHSDFETIDLGDQRLVSRFFIVLCRMMDSPLKSIAAACRGWAETQAAYRLLNNMKLNPSAMLAPHREAAVLRAGEHRCVAVVQDTTELDFSTKKKMKGTGPLNSEARRGYLAHTQFILTEDRLPLGILDTHIYARSDEDFRKRKKQAPIETKESYRWLKGYQQACELAESLSETEVFSISDREGDIYEIYYHWDQLQTSSKPFAHWIIRVNQNRSLVAPDTENQPADEETDNGAPPAMITQKLFEKASSGRELGTIEYEIKSKEYMKKVKGNRSLTVRSSRTVKQRIRSCKVTPKAPYRKGSKLGKVTFWMICVQEIDPPEGEDPIYWVLLTSKPVNNFEDAQRILKLYLARWEIEVFHRVLKTGCKVEEIQLKDDPAVLNCIVLYMIVAWRILYLTWLGRDCPELPCGVFFEEAEWKSALAVSRLSKPKKNKKNGEQAKDQQQPDEPTLGEMLRIVAELGGHLGRKNDGPPGAQVIWQGLSRIRDFAIAWEAFRN